MDFSIYITPFNKRNYNGTPSLREIDKHNALVYILFDWNVFLYSHNYISYFLYLAIFIVKHF